MKYVVTGMDLRLVGDIGNCTTIVTSNHRQLMQLAWHINHRTCCFYVLSLCDKTPLKTLIARGRDGEKCRGSDYLKGDHSQNPEIYFRPTFLNYFASFLAKMKIIFEVDNFNIFCQRLVYLYKGFTSI